MHELRGFFNGFKNEPSYEVIGEVILKIDLVWDVKKLIKKIERLFIVYKDTHNTN